MAAYQLNDLVSTALARHAGEGIVSSLQYSLRLQELILGIFAVSIGTVLLPDLAEYAKSSQWEIFNSRLISAINIIALITIPITFFFMAQGRNLVRLLFQSGSFNDESVALTLSAFSFHMPGLFFIALNRVLAPAFYAQSNSKSPTLAGLLSFAVNISLAALLVGRFKGSGIALALTVASVVNTVFLIAFLKKNPFIEVGRALKSAVGYTLRLAALSAIAVIPVLLLAPRLEAVFAGRGRLLAQGLPLLINGLMFAAIGIVLLIITKDKQLRALRGMITKKLEEFTTNHTDHTNRTNKS
jgi:putative peptidoglycan lipid II flippase